VVGDKTYKQAINSSSAYPFLRGFFNIHFQFTISRYHYFTFIVLCWRLVAMFV